MADWWFTYAPFDSPEYLARVLGRNLQGESARLKDYQWVEHPAYTHLIPKPGKEVRGLLVPMQTGDDWLLDDEFGIQHGYYRRHRAAVESARGSLSAWVMVGGPALSLALQGQEDSESA